MCAVVVLTTGTGCGKKRLTECEDLVAALDKVVKCPGISTDARTSLQASAASMRATLEQIERGGGIGEAPAELVNTMRDACKVQLKHLVDDTKLGACTK